MWGKSRLGIAERNEPRFEIASEWAFGQRGKYVLIRVTDYSIGQRQAHWVLRREQMPPTNVPRGREALGYVCEVEHE